MKRPTEGSWVRTALLACGIVAPIWYAAMNVIAARAYPRYRWTEQSISEFSAKGAPTRKLWGTMGVPYSLLLVGFARGVWKASEGRRALRVVAWLLMAQFLLSLYWPQMHRRGHPPGPQDALHVVFTGIWGLLMAATMLAGAAAFGRAFRVYSGTTLSLNVSFGVVVGLQSQGILQGEATPELGLWERFGVAGTMLWTMLFASQVMRLPESSRAPLSASSLVHQ